MADINHVITLGIGTPGAIPEFLTVGLQIAVVSTPDTGEIGRPPGKNLIGLPDTKALIGTPQLLGLRGVPSGDGTTIP